MEKVKVAWIDDEKEREEDKKNIISKNDNLHIEIMRPEYFVKNLINEEFDLYLIDYHLDEKKNNEKQRYKHKGMTIAGMIRDEYPQQPIYAMSNKTNNPDGIFKSKSDIALNTFDRIFTFKQIQMNGHRILYNDAIDFSEIRKSKKNDWFELMKLLAAPEDSKEYLRLVLPTELKSGLTKNKRGSVISFSKWIFNTLFRIPGFLYKEYNTATYLGVTIKGFLKIKKHFKDAEYNGVFHETIETFHETIETLWWKSTLNRIIFSKTSHLATNKLLPNELIPEIFEIDDKEIAKCCVCNEKYPDSLGTNEKNVSDIRPVHYFCSYPDNKRKRELYFDEARLFKLK